MTPANSTTLLGHPVRIVTDARANILALVRDTPAVDRPADSKAANDAALRLFHVRTFLETLDRRVPWGIPVEIADVIADELKVLEDAAAVAVERAR